MFNLRAVFTPHPRCSTTYIFLIINRSLHISINTLLLFESISRFFSPLIRSRPWRYINLLTYLLTYLLTFRQLRFSRSLKTRLFYQFFSPHTVSLKFKLHPMLHRFSFMDSGTFWIPYTYWFSYLICFYYFFLY